MWINRKAVMVITDCGSTLQIKSAARDFKRAYRRIIPREIRDAIKYDRAYRDKTIFDGKLVDCWTFDIPDDRIPTFSAIVSKGTYGPGV